ncbi:geranylgeranyl pyrophosphate synthase [Sorangium atrum]|uniref:Geranylgeranyl pyrophosphate synthase n=1 Tax=Sorangium atrum TaxID=2995308 RepID=A0ABT5C9Z8_9BACT|nr:geranylgeranyl pyrophosphate synthase [Sorangium aterium]MDC0683261.1 geranylgeranyl pyrophosphate synthase [Sorangium aterium]
MSEDSRAGGGEGARGAVEAALEAEVLRRLASFRARLGSGLGALFDELAARLRLFEGEPGDGYFSHPTALPVLELPLWVATRPGGPPLARDAGSPALPPLAVDLAEAAAVGYLHVRIEDDLLDEGVGEPAATVLLSGALFARHQTLLARVLPGGSAFWGLFEEVWLGYGEAMLLERRLHRGAGPQDGATFRRVLARSRPLVLPAAAALFALSQAEHLAALEEFVSALVAAHQLFADLLHAEKDRDFGNTTYVLSRIWALAAADAAPPSGDVVSAGPRRDQEMRSATALRARLFARGGFDAILEEARCELARAEVAAGALGLPEAARFCREREQYMVAIQRRVFLAFFSALAGDAR